MYYVVPVGEGQPGRAPRGSTVLGVEHVVVSGSARPRAMVLAAFEGEPVPVSGGQGRSWLVGQAVLKPLDMPLPALQWHAELLTRLDGREDLRVSVPLRTPDGEWASSGWTAWPY